MNLELKARISGDGTDIVDINGFQYKLYRMEVGGHTNFKVLFPIFTDMHVGDCFMSTKWIITRLNKENNPVDLCVRVDDFERVESKDFVPSQYLNSKVTGMFLNSEKCVLKTVGPDLKPFYMATLKMRDSFKVSYEMLLVAFGKTAKELSVVPKQSIIACEVTVKPKRDKEGYEFAVIKFEVKTEAK